MGTRAPSHGAFQRLPLFLSALTCPSHVPCAVARPASHPPCPTLAREPSHTRVTRDPVNFPISLLPGSTGEGERAAAMSLPCPDTLRVRMAATAAVQRHAAIWWVARPGGWCDTHHGRIQFSALFFPGKNLQFGNSKS
jgi:hypothetical protein